MKNLTVVHANFGKPFVSSIELFKGFEYKTHKMLKRVIFNNQPEFEAAGKIIVVSVDTTIISSGMPETTCHLNEEQFILLCLLVKNTPSSIKIKAAIAKEFTYLRSIKYDPDRKAAIAYKRDSYKLMMDFKKAMLEHYGIKISNAEFIKENLFCNRALTGKWASIDESMLDAHDLKLLGEIRSYNMILIVTIGIKQTPRKEPMQVFVEQYRIRNQRIAMVQL